MTPLKLNKALSKRERGVTLIELLIAVAIGSFILLGLTTLASSSSRNERELSRSARQLDNARYALQIMGDDIKLAGFFGAQYNLGDPTAAALNVCDTPPTTVEMAVPILGANNLAADPTAGTCAALGAFVAGTDAVSVRRAASFSYLPAALVADSAAEDNWYVQTHPNANPLLREGDNAGDFTYTFLGGNIAPARKYLNNIYYVANYTNTPGDGIPALRRVVFDEGDYDTDEVIAEGVENMQIQYGFDTDDDGVANEFHADPTTLSTPPTNTTELAEAWATVVNVRIFLLVRNTETSQGHTSAKSFNLGGVAVAAANDGFKRNVYTTTVRVVNVSNRRGTVIDP